MSMGPSYDLRHLNPLGAQHGVTQEIADLGKWAADVIDAAEVLHKVLEARLKILGDLPLEIRSAALHLGEVLRREKALK